MTTQDSNESPMVVASRLLDIEVYLCNGGSKKERLTGPKREVGRLLKKQVTPDLGREIETIIGESGAAFVVHQKRTFVVVEVEEQPVTFPQGVYDVTEPDEVADIEDALDDNNNPVFVHEEALDYLRQLRGKRHGRR